jgi:hypothetical protein
LETIAHPIIPRFHHAIIPGPFSHAAVNGPI